MGYTTVGVTTGSIPINYSSGIAPTNYGIVQGGASYIADAFSSTFMVVDRDTIKAMIKEAVADMLGELLGKENCTGI